MMSIFIFLVHLCAAHARVLSYAPYVLLNGRYDMEEGSAECVRAMNQDWHLPAGSSKALRDFLKERNIPMAWLGVKKTILKKWTWNTGLAYQHSSELDANAAGFLMDCGGVTVRQNGQISPMRCSDSAGFVCEMPKFERCPEKHHTHSCITLNDIVYVIGCNSDSWYNARNYCLMKGGDLAVLDTKEKIQAPINYITQKQFSAKCSWFFIGLRKHKWNLICSAANYSDRSGNISREVSPDWAAGEPVSGRNCITLSADIASYHWRATQCTDKMQTVCQYYGVNLSHHYNVTPTNSIFKKSSPGTTILRNKLWFQILVLTLFSAAVLGFFFVLACYIWKVKRKYRAKEDIKEQIFSHIPPLTDGVTVVIFSASILKKPPKDFEGMEVKCLDTGPHEHSDKGTRIARHINRTFKQTVDSYEKASLRLICYGGEGTDGRPTPEMMSTLLSRCASDEDDINADLIFMPGSGVPMNLADLRKLSITKGKYVCVTGANRRYCQITASEVITIGVSSYSDELISSGIVDFSIDSSDCKACVGVLESVAAAVGVVAGLIYSMKQSGIDHILFLANL